MIYEIIFFIGLINLIWFETKAVIEYLSLLTRGSNLFYLQDYLIISKETAITYPEFLYEYHNCFLTRLLYCPICISVQLSLLFSIFTSFSNLGIYALGGIAAYKIIKKILDV